MLRSTNVPSRIELVLGALTAARVDYLIVGGVAVVMHGHLRTTADLDLVIRLEPDNALRTVRALTQIGLRPRAPVPAEAFADARICSISSARLGARKTSLISRRCSPSTRTTRDERQKPS